MLAKVKLSYQVSAFLIVIILTSSQSFMNANAAPGTGNLFGTDGKAGNLYTIDKTTGAATPVGPLGFLSAPSLAVDPTTGTMYAGQGAGSPIVYTVDTSTGAATLVGDSGLGFGAITAMDFRSDGTLFAAVNIVGDGGTGGDHLATIDKATGVATVIGSFGTCSTSCDLEGMEAIAFSSSGQLFGATTGVGQDPALYSIDTTTGHATFLKKIMDASGKKIPIASLQFACDGTLYAGTGKNAGNLGTIDTSIGTFTLKGNSFATGSLAALAFQDNCPTTHPGGTAVGGTIIPIDMTSLFVAGIFTNAFWILPTLGGIAGVAIAVFGIKRKLM